MARVFSGGLTRLKGRAGDYYYRKALDGGTIMSAMPRQSEKKPVQSQMTRRIRWGNLVNAWQKMGKSMSFESKPANQSDYNAFMSVNLSDPMLPILAKGDAMREYVIPHNYVLSQGSLVNPNLMEQDEVNHKIIIPKTSSTSDLKGFIDTLVLGGYSYNQQVTFIFLSDFVNFSSPQFCEIHTVDLVETSFADLPSWITYVAGGEDEDPHYELHFAKNPIMLASDFCVWMINGAVVDSRLTVGSSVMQSTNDLTAFLSWILVNDSGYEEKAIASYGGTRTYPFLQNIDPGHDS